MSELGLATVSIDPRHLSLRAFLEYELGQPDEGAAYLARLHEVAESVPPRARSPTTCSCRRHDRAGRSQRGRRRKPGRGRVVRRGGALASEAQSDVGHVRNEPRWGSSPCYEAMPPRPSGCTEVRVADGHGELLRSARHRSSPRVALLGVRADGRRAGSLQRRAVVLRRAGYRPEYARAAADCAEALAARGVAWGRGARCRPARSGARHRARAGHTSTAGPARVPSDDERLTGYFSGFVPAIQMMTRLNFPSASMSKKLQLCMSFFVPSRARRCSSARSRPSGPRARRRCS